MRKHEAGNLTVGSAVTLAVGAACYAAVFAYFIGVDSGGDQGQARLEAAQAQNAQIAGQLTPNFDQVVKLVLDSDSHSFSFDAVDSARQPEICTGNYAVKNDAASISGALACTKSLLVRGN